jgi:5-methyltetrahydropteroyltriglutamate--homocysteine methyltransferase
VEHISKFGESAGRRYEAGMKRSTDRILTTHTGSLPRPADLVALLNAKELGEDYDGATYDARVRRAISEIVAKQAATGIDVIDDGEHSKVNWMAYARARLFPGWRRSTAPPVSRRDARLARVPRRLRGHARDAGGALWRAGREAHVRPRAQVCTGPIKYVGQAELAQDIANLKAALNGARTKKRS